jgi:hypothetical protein
VRGFGTGAPAATCGDAFVALVDAVVAASIAALRAPMSFDSAFCRFQEVHFDTSTFQVCCQHPVCLFLPLQTSPKIQGAHFLRCFSSD